MRTTIELPDDLWLRARQAALNERRPANDLVREALELYLKPQKVAIPTIATPAKPVGDVRADPSVDSRVARTIPTEANPTEETKVAVGYPTIRPFGEARAAPKPGKRKQ